MIFQIFARDGVEVGSGSGRYTSSLALDVDLWKVHASHRVCTFWTLVADLALMFLIAYSAVVLGCVYVL